VSKRSIAKGTDTPKQKVSLFETEKIIEALAGLKKRRKYPGLPGEILTALSLPKSRIQALKDYLKRLGKDGILMPSRKGRFVGYMLAGEDPRYSTRPDIALKFELLTEIERLRGELLEMRANLIPPGASADKSRPSAAHDSGGLEEQVFQTIATLSRSRNRRTLDLWEVRRALPDLPSDVLDAVLETLGSSWRIELQLVQDSTKLSAQERNALLRLADGSVVGAVAVTTN
jgi:hypothetical protein